MKDIDEISGDVLDVALRLHRDLGPGLLESVDVTLLAGRLEQMGYHVRRQEPVSIEYFGGETLKEGLKRIVNDYRPSAPSRLRVNQNSGSE